MKPDEVLQLLAPKIVSNPEISDKIDKVYKEIEIMSDEPKINVSNSKEVNIALSSKGSVEQNINNRDSENKNQTKESFKKKEPNWAVISIIITVIGIGVSATVSGVLNEEVRQWIFKKNPLPPIQEKSSPNNSQLR